MLLLLLLMLLLLLVLLLLLRLITRTDDDDNEFVLHDRDYHGLTVVNKYSVSVQDFGPNKIVTIPEGLCGVFEKEGSIQIKEPGFYR